MTNDPALTTCAEGVATEASAATNVPVSSPRFWFAPNGFENTPHPCLCVDDPLGGDPHILALLSVIYRPTDLNGLCEMANAYLNGLTSEP